MTEMQADLTAVLRSDPVLFALVAERIHWDRVPATVQGRPYIAMTIVSGPRAYHYRGASALRTTRVQVDIWAETTASLRDVATALEARLSAYRGVQGATNFRAVFLDAERAGSGDTAGDERPLFRRTHDYIINWFQEA